MFVGLVFGCGFEVDGYDGCVWEELVVLFLCGYVVVVFIVGVVVYDVDDVECCFECWVGVDEEVFVVCFVVLVVDVDVCVLWVVGCGVGVV